MLLWLLKKCQNPKSSEFEKHTTTKMNDSQHTSQNIQSLSLLESQQWLKSQVWNDKSCHSGLFAEVHSALPILIGITDMSYEDIFNISWVFTEWALSKISILRCSKHEVRATWIWIDYLNEKLHSSSLMWKKNSDVYLSHSVNIYINMNHPFNILARKTLYSKSTSFSSPPHLQSAIQESNLQQMLLENS